ncbi:MAG: hypothetical protein EA369_05800 [Bradymonadales bacterium]|nr:MAG: hypothetical protein EA369_05800 [Bradymonadales bacterium]
MLFLNQKGEIVADPPNLSILDHGFLFGDSIYEVVRIYQGRFFAWQEHFDRLERSAGRLKFSFEGLRTNLRPQAEKLVKAFAKPEAALRIIITRGEGILHINPTTCKSPQVFMAIWELPAQETLKPFRVMIPSVRRNHPRTLDPAIKSGNYLNSVMAYHEALDAGYEDALFLSLDDSLCELTTSNIAWISKSTLYTPPLEMGILKGVTREHFLRVENVKEEAWSWERLGEIDEIFALSTLKELLPIQELRDLIGRSYYWKEFHGTMELQASFRDQLKNSLRSEKELVKI